ncbi:MAG: DNA primase [Candidatus Aminicenantes bacterium]|nr:DNA primase [Candidatus Aminicenantes bacterium]
MDAVDQIKQVASIIEIASQYTSLKKRGRRFVGLCPFHSEKTPSFTIDEDRQLFHCFGCGAGGDLFTLVMEKENLSFPESVRYLAEKYNVELPKHKKMSSKQQSLKEKLYKITNQTLAYYKKNLFNTAEGKQGLQYLKKRGISEDLINQLKIGYALNSWDSLLQYFQLNKQNINMVEKTGLVMRRKNKSGFYDRFRGRVMFPIMDVSGKAVAFGGRTLFNDDPKYMNSPDSSIYTKGQVLYGLNFSKESIRKEGQMILVEGYTDFLSLFQRGITNVAASLGTSLTENQAALASRFSKTIAVAYDSDDAGKKASCRAVSICFAQGLRTRVLSFPKGHDPDSYITNQSAEKFNSLVKQSPSGLRFLIQEKRKGKNLDSPEEKAEVAREIMESIKHIPDSIVLSEYLKQTSEYLSIDEQQLRNLVRKKRSSPEKSQINWFLNAEKRLLQIIFQNGNIAAKLFEHMEEDDYQGLKSESIFQIFSDFFKKGRSISNSKIYELKEKINPSLFSALTEILVEESPPASIDEAKDCLLALRRFVLPRQVKKLQNSLKKCENRLKTTENGENKDSLKKEIHSLFKEIDDKQKILYQISKENSK